VTDCLFCQIVRGGVPAKKVAETADVLAFRDINPQAPTHVLLIPKRHVAASAAELSARDGALVGEMFALAARIASDEGLASGWRLVTNVGPHAGQSVFHLHFHLVGGAPLGRFGT
jgi:histidine triad (HIT) family protein